MKEQDEIFMREALAEAMISYEQGDIPIGAVVVYEGRIIGRGHNEKEATKNPLTHAEMTAIAQATRTLHSYHLEECTIYVTLEPCLMCVGAMINSRMGRLVYGAYNRRFGAVQSHVDLLTEGGFNHRTQHCGGILEQECSKLLSRFFRQLRAQKKKEQEK